MYSILVIEDEHDILDSINEILLSTGYKPILATDGEEALKKLNSEIPDLIISDIMMPKMDGYSLYNLLKQNSIFAEIPFIFLTAKADPSDIRKGMGLGAEDYITKPFRAKDLLNAIEIRLKKKKKINEKIDIIKENIALYVPHELRTPLVSIMGYTDILSTELEELRPEEAQSMIKSIGRSARRLHETIEKFVLYSELVLNDSNNSLIMSGNLTPVDSTLKFAIPIIKVKAREKGRHDDITINIEDSKCNIFDTPFQVLITQLLDNAMKFSQTGTRIEITGKKDENFYTLRISDEGVGMSQEQISAIDSFIQFDRDKFQQIGNGLGLAIVNKIVNNVNGKIKINSKAGFGTSVEVNLPYS